VSFFVWFVFIDYIVHFDSPLLRRTLFGIAQNEPKG